MYKAIYTIYKQISANTWDSESICELEKEGYHTLKEAEDDSLETIGESLVSSLAKNAEYYVDAEYYSKSETAEDEWIKNKSFKVTFCNGFVSKHSVSE